MVEPPTTTPPKMLATPTTVEATRNRPLIAAGPPTTTPPKTLETPMTQAAQATQVEHPTTEPPKTLDLPPTTTRLRTEEEPLTREEAMTPLSKTKEQHPRPPGIPTTTTVNVNPSARQGSAALMARVWKSTVTQRVVLTGRSAATVLAFQTPAMASLVGHHNSAGKVNAFARVERSNAQGIKFVSTAFAPLTNACAKSATLARFAVPPTYSVTCQGNASPIPAPRPTVKTVRSVNLTQVGVSTTPAKTSAVLTKKIHASWASAVGRSFHLLSCPMRSPAQKEQRKRLPQTKPHLTQQQQTAMSPTAKAMRSPPPRKTTHRMAWPHKTKASSFPHRPPVLTDKQHCQAVAARPNTTLPGGGLA